MRVIRHLLLSVSLIAFAPALVANQALSWVGTWHFHLTFTDITPHIENDFRLLITEDNGTLSGQLIAQGLEISINARLKVVKVKNGIQLFWDSAIEDATPRFETGDLLFEIKHTKGKYVTHWCNFTPYPKHSHCVCFTKL